MRDIAQQLLFRFQQVAQPRRHRVQVRGQQAQIVLPPPQAAGDADIEIAGGELARRQPQFVHGRHQISGQEKADSTAHDERDRQSRGRHARELQVAEHALLQIQGTDDDVIGAAVDSDQHERAPDGRDGSGGAVGLLRIIGRGMQERRQRPAGHLFAGRVDDEGAIERFVVTHPVDPFHERIRAARPERLRGLQIQLFTLNPRPQIAIVQRGIDRQDHRADQNQGQGQPEREENSPVE